MFTSFFNNSRRRRELERSSDNEIIQLGIEVENRLNRIQSLLEAERAAMREAVGAASRLTHIWVHTVTDMANHEWDI